MLTPEDCEAEFWAHYYADNAGKGEEFEDEDFDLELAQAGVDLGGSQASMSDDEWEDVING